MDDSHDCNILSIGGVCFCVHILDEDTLIEIQVDYRRRRAVESGVRRGLKCYYGRRFRYRHRRRARAVAVDAEIGQGR